MAADLQIDTLGGTPSNILPTQTHASMARKQAGRHARTTTHTHTLTRAEPCHPVCFTASVCCGSSPTTVPQPPWPHAKAVMAAHSQARPPLLIRRENVIRPASPHRPSPCDISRRRCSHDTRSTLRALGGQPALNLDEQVVRLGPTWNFNVHACTHTHMRAHTRSDGGTRALLGVHVQRHACTHAQTRVHAHHGHAHRCARMLA